MDDLDGLLLRMKEHSTRSIMGRSVKRLGENVFYVDGSPTTRTGAVRALSTFTHADHRGSRGSKTKALGNAKLYYEIRSSDVGKSLLRAFGRSWPVVDFIGIVMRQDVGKRVYESGGVLQFESNEQRDRRLGISGRTSAKFGAYYEIRPSDVNKALIHAFGRSWSVTGFIGRIMKQDVGKRVYESDGVLQVENNEQRDRRLGISGRTSAKFGAFNKREVKIDPIERATLMRLRDAKSNDDRKVFIPTAEALQKKGLVTPKVDLIAQTKALGRGSMEAIEQRWKMKSLVLCEITQAGRDWLAFHK